MKNLSPNKGMILLDILLAFSLSILFVAIITEASISSQRIYESAEINKELLDLYDSGQGSVSAKFYGNDLVEEDVQVTLPPSSQPSSLSSLSNELRFVKISAASDDLVGQVGTPLCSADYSNNETIGTYEYFHSLDNSQQPNSQSTTVTQITLPIDPSLPLTDIEVRNDIAYISADSSAASDPDFLIADIHDLVHPTIISSINTGPGLVSLTLAQKRIFAAAPSTVGELHVIRLDGLANPVLEKKYKLPLPYATATPALASSIFYSDNKVYLGTEKWDGEEFNIIDVSDPISPTKIGGFEIGSKVNDIYIRDHVALVAASNQNQLLAILVEDPANPTPMNIFSPSGWSRQEGKTISLFENNLNFGRTSGGFNFTSDHEAFGWVAPISPDYSLITNFTNPFSIDIPGGVYGIVRDRSRIYLATRQVNKELQIFDDKFSASTTVSYSLPVAPQTMICDGDFLYILTHTAPVIYKVKLGGI